MQEFVKIHEQDNVAVALRPLEKGEVFSVDGEMITTQEQIPQGHKFALKLLKVGEEVIKYGFRIGFAKEDILPGAWIHVHNIRTGLGDLLTYTYDKDSPAGNGTCIFSGLSPQRREGRGEK